MGHGRFLTTSSRDIGGFLNSPYASMDLNYPVRNPKFPQQLPINAHEKILSHMQKWMHGGTYIIPGSLTSLPSRQIHQIHTICHISEFEGVRQHGR